MFKKKKSTIMTGVQRKIGKQIVEMEKKKNSVINTWDALLRLCDQTWSVQDLQAQCQMLKLSLNQRSPDKNEPTILLEEEF